MRVGASSGREEQSGSKQKHHIQGSGHSGQTDAALHGRSVDFWGRDWYKMRLGTGAGAKIGRELRCDLLCLMDSGNPWRVSDIGVSRSESQGAWVVGSTCELGPPGDPTVAYLFLKLYQGRGWARLRAEPSPQAHGLLHGTATWLNDTLSRF